jgi:hypothetical protein
VAIPGTASRPWHARDAWTSLASNVLPVIATLAAALQESASAKPSRYLLTLYWVGVTTGLLAVVLSVSRARHQDAKADRKESPEDLRGCLHVILRIVSAHKRVLSPPEGWMRLTVHRVDDFRLEQVVDYVGSADGGAGRSLPSDCGLVGAVLEQRTALVIERPPDLDQRSWAEYLVQVLKMPRLSARGTRRDRFSFIGIPIVEPRGTVAAVVYADAAEPRFFDHAVQAILIHGCIGLARWVNERYYS